MSRIGFCRNVVKHKVGGYGRRHLDTENQELNSKKRAKRRTVGGPETTRVRPRSEDVSNRHQTLFLFQAVHVFVCVEKLGIVDD